MHDLSFEYFPYFFSWKRRLWHFLVNPRWLCRRADLILAVSESTKEDISTLYHIVPERIMVKSPPLAFTAYAPGSLTHEEQQYVLQQYGIQVPYILFLGTIEPRKNVESLIQAFERLQAFAREDPEYRTVRLQGNTVIDYQSLHLVIAGGWGWNTRSVRKRYQQSKVRSHIHFTGTMTEADKPLIYRGATVFVYPSFFEGFGFPPLEAMASGVPVITSNCSAIPEVVDDAAVLIDPYRPDDLYRALRMLLDDRAVYAWYLRQGKQRIIEVTSRTESYGAVFQQAVLDRKGKREDLNKLL